MGSIWYSDINSLLIKLDALENLESLLCKGVCVCNSETYERLQFSRALRTSEIVLAVIFIAESGKCLIPNSAINLRVGKSGTKTFENSCRVTEKSIVDTNTKKETIKIFNHKPGLNKKQRRARKKAKQQRDRG